MIRPIAVVLGSLAVALGDRVLADARRVLAQEALPQAVAAGRSANVLRGLTAARRVGAAAVALTGVGGLPGGDADYILAVPATTTSHIQELHLMILHYWCVLLESL